MSELTSEPLALKRLVVALNSSPGAELAAEAAAALAARLHAQLHGIFVEDINLVHLAALPVGRLIRRGTAKGGPFDESVLLSHFALERSRSRRVLESASARRGVAATFAVSRGRVEVEVVTASREADLLIIALAEQPRGVHVGSTALAAAEGCTASVLLLRSGAAPGARTMVLLDSPESPGKVLGMALGLTSGPDAEICIVPTDPSVAPARWEALLRSLSGHRVAARLSPVEGELSVTALCAKAAEVAAEAVVMSADNPSLRGERRRELLEKLACPVLLVR